MRALFLRQVLMNRSRRALAVRDGLDEVAGPECHVTAREHALCAGGQGLGIDLHRAAPLHLDPVRRLQEGEIGLLADGEDAGVGFDGEDVVVIVGRREASVLVEDRADGAQLDRLEPGLAHEALGSPPGQEGDAFVLRLLELFVSLGAAQDGHLLEALQGDDGDLRGAPRMAARAESMASLARASDSDTSASSSSSAVSRPRRSAVRAASKATKPPPMTTTRRPSGSR
jgi:hypothetical protein